MGYVAHKKQALAHQAFMSGGYKRGLLMWGRQCFAPDTLIQTAYGLVPIAELVVGDEVLSYGNKPEYKPVTAIREYGVDQWPKPMIDCIINGQDISCTYDHPFYQGSDYVPLYQLAWGKMAASQRRKLELLCKQYGQTINHEAIRRVRNSSHEARTGWERLSENRSGWPHNQDTSVGGSDLDSKPREQTDSKSQEREENGQSDFESRMDDFERERTTRPRQWVSSRQSWRKLRDSHSERTPGSGNIALSSNAPINAQADYGKRTVQTLPSGEDRQHKGHFKRQKLEISAVRVLPSAVTYSIEVADNHNYCITEENILVKNSGKTYFSTQHAWISAVLNQGRYFIVFQTYKQAHEVVWRQYIPLIPKELVYKTNEQDLLVELNYVENTPVTLPSGETIMVNHDKDKPRSTIQLLGSDQADTHRGFKGHGIIFDEYATQNPDHWDAVYKHFFTTTDGWAIFMGTPRGYNHFYDLKMDAETNPRWFYQEATWRDSPYVKKEFIEEEKAEAIRKGTLSSFMQEVELEFRSVQGAVYPVFDRKVHLIKPADIPEELTYYGAIDFGWHTTAFLLLGVDKDQTWYVIDEVYGKEETLEDVLPRIKNVIGDKRIVLIVADSANRDAIEIMNKSMPVVGVNKANDAKGYATGIGLVTEKLKPRIQLVGLPKPSLFIGQNCKHFIYEMESYRFPEEKPERNPSDVPVKEDDHGPDAIRYFFLHLKYGMVKDDKPLEFEMAKHTNEFGIL